MTIRKKGRWCENFGRTWKDQRPGLERLEELPTFWKNSNPLTNYLGESGIA